MSPDDIFAAQFWPWPDPAIKRDAQGRVLFVNAAFLALYGGQVENWRGNAVGGWPVPQSAGSAPYRFETRLPSADGHEKIYDWMEQTLADGNAFALARDVTVFTHSPEPDPAQVMVPEEAPAAQSAEVTPPPMEAPAHQAEAVQEHINAPLETAVNAPVEQSFEVPEIPEVPAVHAEAPTIPVPDIEIPNIEIPSDDAYEMTQSPETQSPETQPVAQEITQEPAMAPAPTQEQPFAPDREYERRALPIEDESAVLGNNWRDAVIARAVGAEDVAPDGATEMGAETAPEETVPETTSGDSIRILLAEDNAINALLTRTLLEAEGHTVDTVEDGVLAVEAMKTARYDLIFMDMRMPNMDGLEATRKIRALSNVGRTLPIIALTANAFDDDRNACFDSGMNDFMTKPVSAEELSEKVRDWTSEDAKARLAQAA